MTPGRKTSNLHYVPWNGNIETNIDEARASQLLIQETPEVTKILTAQIERMTEAGVDGFRYALPTANGVIVNCDNPQQAYDAVYGGVAKPENKAKVVPFVPAFQNSIQLHNVFGGVAQNDNGVSRAPKLDRAFDRATQAPVLGGYTAALTLAA